jgi:TetR/AcrR family transcriptional regulator of autoinduction and epiphytic fitness
VLREKETSTDGRADRAVRTRCAVVEAQLSLIEAGELRPTARQIAGQAGVSLRSVFQHFEDLDAIVMAVAQRQFERYGHLVETRPAKGPLTDRLESFVLRRSKLLEGITPVRRSALVSEPFSPQLAKKLDWARRGFRSDVAAAFDPELDRVTHGERREFLAALDTATCWEAWENLRRRNGLSVGAASRAMKRTLQALIADTAVKP